MQALRKDNVKVMLINPGPIATAMTEVNMADLMSVHVKSTSAYMHWHFALKAATHFEQEPSLKNFVYSLC